jgi:hypothetical protein
MLALDLLTHHRFRRWAPLPLRLIVGFGFMEHGFAKLSKGPDAFAAILHALGVPAPDMMARLTILIEIGGGLAVLLGALVVLAAMPMARGHQTRNRRISRPDHRQGDFVEYRSRLLGVRRVASPQTRPATRRALAKIRQNDFPTIRKRILFRSRGELSHRLSVLSTAARLVRLIHSADS